MSRMLAPGMIAAAAALGLTGCIPLPPTSAFAAEAQALLDAAGAVYPERGDNASTQQMVLELGEGMCVAADELEGQPSMFGVELVDMLAIGLTGALQIDGETADEFIQLSFEHLCPEHAD